MTRKDYIRFAAMLKELNCVDHAQVNWDWFTVNFTSNFADVLAADNANFNRARFLKACGVNS